MKKTGIIIIGTALITALSFSACGKTPETETTTAASAISGNVVYLQSKYVLTATNDNIESSSSVYKYDEQGNLLMTVYYDKDEKMTGWDTDYTYDDNGNELVHVQYDADGNAYGFVSREYDENQKVKRYTTYSISGEIITDTTYEYTYDANNNMILMACFDENGKHVQDNEYDEHGKVTKQTYYLENNSTAVYEYDNEYDANGNNIATSIYVRFNPNEDRQLDSRNEMTYDSHNNMIKLVHYNKTGKTDFYYEIEYFEFAQPA